MDRHRRIPRSLCTNLVKAYATDFCGTKTLREASTGTLEHGKKESSSVLLLRSAKSLEVSGLATDWTDRAMTSQEFMRPEVDVKDW